MLLQHPDIRAYHGREALDALVRAGGVSLPFSTPRWIETVLGSRIEETLVVLDMTTEAGRLLLPFMRTRIGPFTLGRMVGGSYANYHAAMLEGTVGKALEGDALRDALTSCDIDCLLITDSPQRFGDHDNPLAPLLTRPSPDVVHALTLSSAWDAQYSTLFDRDARKKHRQKAVKRSEIGESRASFIHEQQERATCLSHLLKWKTERFAAQGIPDPFASHDAIAMLESGLENGALRLFALFAGERMIAGMIGAVSEARFSGIVIAHDPDPDLARTSPGEALLLALCSRLAQDGYRYFDLGAGEARYKNGFCPERIALYDLAMASTWKGAIIARCFYLARALKRRVKASDRAMRTVQALRGIRARFRRSGNT